MTNDQSNSNSQNPKQKYDLEERTINFSKDIIDFCKKLPQNSINRSLVSQLIRSGTSIGANYSEADEANSKKDFINKIAISKKETKETKYWLRLIAHTFPDSKQEARELWKEAQELNLILAAIIRSSQKK
ncbi:MAG: four helix bundle protein [Zetaproteobacteria bacterium CG02_land_8_20_14_3_00_50_9]|nr:MAG: four helix bundle protein [Zetaproteobacteria bacterium CG02_land_8_20_14_3_00_50_9]